MQNIQEIFQKIREMKKEQKELREMYKDALAQTDNYGEIAEKINELREKKKQIEVRVQGEMGKAYEKLEDLKTEAVELQQMLTDIAISTLMEGSSVEVKDEYDNPYEPSFKVSFKKSDMGRTQE